MSSLWQAVQNLIPHISFEDNFYESTSGMREFRHRIFQSLILRCYKQYLCAVCASE